jgi:hypothetical protein
MNSVGPATPVATASVPVPESVAVAPSSLLPPPECAAAGPQDVLGMLLMLIEQQGQASSTASEREIAAAQTQLKEELAEYLKALRDAAERAREEAKDDGGWFSDVVDCVASVAGEIIGAIADFAVDAITLPIDTTKAMVEGLTKGRNVLAALGSELADLGRNGSVAEDVKGFTRGVIKFVADANAFFIKLEAAIVKAALSGENVWQAMGAEAEQLWGSLKSNILENEHFWVVTGEIAKVVAVAGLVMSGGALAPVALALIAVSELDKHTNFIEDAVGEKAAPWVRLGLQLATAVCAGIALAGQNSSALVRGLSAGVSIVQGGGAVYQGVQTIIEAQREAAELERQAELTKQLQLVQRLQRMIEALLGELKGKTEHQSTTRELSSELYQIQGATSLSLIVRA